MRLSKPQETALREIAIWPEPYYYRYRATSMLQLSDFGLVDLIVPQAGKQQFWRITDAGRQWVKEHPSG